MKFHIVARQIEDGGRWVASVGNREFEDESLDVLVARCRDALASVQPALVEGADYEISASIEIGDALVTMPVTQPYK